MIRKNFLSLLYMKRYLFFTTIALAAFTAKPAQAVPDTLFAIPDTICAGNLVTPDLFYTEGRNYDWKFCSPPYALPPSGTNLGNELGAFTPTDLVIARDVDFFVGWVINKDHGLVRWNFRNGIEALPIIRYYGLVEETLPTSPSGIELVQNGDKWYLFVIGGTNESNSSLARYSFDHTMKLEMADSVNLGDLDGNLNNPKKLFIGLEDDRYIGYTFNRGRELIRLDFGTDITATPETTNLGNIGGLFNNVTAIEGTREGDNWHIFVTDRGSKRLVKLTFGTSLYNTPYAINYENLEGELNYPHGIAFVQDCMEYYGYIINNVGSHLSTLYWEESVADTANAWNNGNLGEMKQPMAMSHFVSDSGNMYFFVLNSDSTVSRIKFDNCGSANYPGSNEMIPPPFTFNTPGNYNVYLTVDQGTSNMRSYCKPITVVAGPDVRYSNDTLICKGDTIKLNVQYSEDVPIRWSPDYMISSLDDKTVDVWPEFSTTYKSVIPFYENCVLENDIHVTVSQIAADAGADRTITDGSDIIIGGPMTPEGDDYSYNWFPTDYILGSTSRNITTAKPGQSITYYLEVFNTDGCYAIDSVIITVNCDDITLPNAFVPEGKGPRTANFGLMNLQFQKLNSFTIYNRWGEVVFTTNDPNKQWDGTHHGKQLPLGVYVWEVDAFCSDGFRIRKQGNVTLIK